MPPGQFVTTKFSVITYGAMPHIHLDQWRLRTWGLVELEQELNWQQFTSLPWTAVTADFHCVAQWSRLNNLWEGVLFRDLARLVKPKPQAAFVMVHCYGEYTTSLPLDVLMAEDVLLAHKHEGKELSPQHGWPLRLVVPSRYGWKSAKWVNVLEFMGKDRLGFWETQGYNNNADPWKEERFWPELE